MTKKTFMGVVILLVFVLTVFWFLFEADRTPPNITLKSEIAYLSKNQEVKFCVEDIKSGIKYIRSTIIQEDLEKEILSSNFQKKEVYNKEINVHIQPGKLGLKDGKATLIIHSRDHSIFNNQTRLEKDLIIDTIPPQIELQSYRHYINLGGSCMTIYSVSKDSKKSGVLVGDIFFTGYPTDPNGTHIVYFAMPWDASDSTPILIIAEDGAGNKTKRSFPYLIRSKRFKKEDLNIPDQFLNQKIPEFTARYDHLMGNNIDIFLEVNRKLRKESNTQIMSICSKSNSKILWEGPFIRMKGASKASFADFRTYYCQGKEIDKQVHMGVDISALKRFPIKAANNGIIVFADYLGIYGNTVIIDHGMGLFSMYAHLSSFDIKDGQEVKKGDVIGRTGTTGLAGGDHLHFSMIVQNTFVNPIEWWDPHWIHDNITLKLHPEESE
jgi:hypothetical protein